MLLWKNKKLMADGARGFQEAKRVIKEGERVKEYQPRTVGEKLDLIREDLDLLMQRDKYKKGKGKGIKVPGRVRRQLKGLVKKRQLIVFLLQVNRGIEAYVSEVKNGLIVVNGRFHSVRPDFIFLWQGKFPAVVLPEWSLEPVGTKDYYEAVKEGKQSDPQEIIIKAIEAHEAGTVPKKKVDVKTLVIIGIVALVAGYVLFSGK